MADGDYEGPIGPLNEKIKADFDAMPAEKRAEIEREYGTGPVLPESLKPQRTSAEYAAELDRAFAAHQALAAEQKTKGPETPPASEDAPRDREADIAAFGRILGVEPGTSEFDSTFATFQNWYDAHADSPDFAQAVASGEKEFGKEVGLEFARFLAEKEAKARR